MVGQRLDFHLVVMGDPPPQDTQLECVAGLVPGQHVVHVMAAAGRMAVDLQQDVANAQPCLACWASSSNALHQAAWPPAQPQLARRLGSQAKPERHADF